MKRIISGMIALTLLTSLGLAGASCVPFFEAKTGIIEVRVTDAPPSYGNIEEILVTVDTSEDEEEGVAVHKADTEEDGEGGWIPIDVTEDNNPFGLLELKEKGVDELLGWADVPVGKYTQIRMTIEKVEVFFEGEDDPIEAELPSGKLKFVRPFEVFDGETTIILLDFDADKSVVITGQGKVIVKPVVKLTIQQVAMLTNQQDKSHQLASVEGTISEVDIETRTISIVPNGGTEADTIVLNVNPQTDITLDGGEATLNNLDELEEGNSVTASYYLNNLKATQIDAQSPSE